MTYWRLAGLLSCAALVGACDGRRPLDPGTSVAPSPIAASPSPIPSPPRSSLANWLADAVVLSATGPGRACGWGTVPGETRRDVEWRITVDGSAILLEEDMLNWPTDHNPFSGTLTGRQFTATYDTGPDYLMWVCQYKGGTLTGTFSDDLSSFEAHETLIWGPPSEETTVHRRWKGSRLH